MRAALEVDLPEAVSGGGEVSATVNLVYTKERVLLLDGSEVVRSQAAAEIKRQADANPELQAVISADKALPYGEVVALIDLVKQSGVRTFALNIERVSPGNAG